MARAKCVGGGVGQRAAQSNESKIKRAKLVALAVTPLAAAIWANSAFATTTLTWDASGAAGFSNPTDGGGNWDSSFSLNWNPGGNSADETWIDGAVGIIGVGSGAAGTIQIDNGPVTASGLQFNAPGSGDYTINGSAIILDAGGPSPVIGVASGVGPTINSALAGSAGFTFNGPGTLNLNGSNTVSGAVAINAGTLNVGSGGNLGASSNAITLGTPTSTTAVGALSLAGGANVTVGNFSTTTNSASVNTLTIGNGATLNVTSNSPLSGVNASVNAAFLVGGPLFSGTSPGSSQATALTVTGGGSLNVSGGTNNASFVVGIGNTSTGGAGAPVSTPTLDMSGLSNFSFTTGTGAVPATGGNEFAVGVGTTVRAVLTLAVNNMITAGTVDIGDGQVTPGATVGGSGGSTPVAGTANTAFNLGSGTNVIQSDNIFIGGNKSTADFAWAKTTTTGTLTITGSTGGASTTNITVGTASSSGTNGSASTFKVTGHSVNIQAGTVVVGKLISGSAATASGGTLSFDSGTFNAATVNLAVVTGGTIAGGKSLTGTFNLGGSSTSTSVLNVSNAFTLASNSGAQGPAVGTFSIGTGGTANVATNIIDNSGGAGTSTTSLTLTGGTLNMSGFAIGPVGAGTGGTRHITNVNYPALGNSATLMNLGGTGVNDAGLTMNGTGTLILEGTNNFTGATSVTAGTLQVGQTSDVTAPTSALPPAVSNSATVAYGSSQSMTITSLISGNGGVVQNGTGVTTVSSNHGYTGPTSVAAGTLSVASVPTAGAGGVNSPLGTSSNAASNLVLTGGALRYTGPGANVDRLFSVTPTGGGLDASGSGAVVYNNGGGVVSADAAARTASSESTSSTTITLPSVYDLVAGMTVTGTNISPGTTIVSVNNAASSIKISVAPTAASSSTSPDTLTFSAAPRTLTLTGTSTANNTLGDALSNSAGGGALSVSKTNVGKWILAATNTYSGNTTANAGTLEIGATGSVASTTLTTGPSGTLNVVGSIPNTATVNANGTVNFAGNATAVTATRTIGTLNIGAGTTAQTVVLPSLGALHPMVLNATAVNFADTIGKIDLTNNELITAGDAPTALALINGGQIVSSSATISPPTGLGYAALPGGQMEIRFTLLGDADLDGAVAVGDLGKLATNYGITGGMFWANGDFNRDQTVDVADLGALATNYGTSLPAGGGGAITDAASPATAVAGGASAVPEPTSLGLLGIAALSMLGGRQRRRRLV